MGMFEKQSIADFIEEHKVPQSHPHSLFLFWNGDSAVIVPLKEGTKNDDAHIFKCAWFSRPFDSDLVQLDEQHVEQGNETPLFSEHLDIYRGHTYIWVGSHYVRKR